VLVDVATFAGLVVLYFLYDYSARAASTGSSNSANHRREPPSKSVAIVVSRSSHVVARAQRFPLIHAKERHGGRRRRTG